MFDIKWDNDIDYNHCYNCASKFNLFLRKHHCRRCGKIFCNECLTKFKIFDKSHSVCFKCNDILNDLIFINKTYNHTYTQTNNSNTTTYTQTINHIPTTIYTQTYNHIPTTDYTTTNNLINLKNIIPNGTISLKSKSHNILDFINKASNQK